ncbi:MAG TPA: malate synthase A [Myxococcota bacterium]|nr:malate synthase A [Myxococcota bacterium]
MTSNLEIAAPRRPGDEMLFTPDALAFLGALVSRFAPRVDERLAARHARQSRLDAGERFDFLAETADVRAADWKIAPVPADLADRRVEITGPVDRKMIINALNSGANVFMADFEDSLAPTWENVVQGQLNLQDAVARRISHTDPASGKTYALAERTAVLVVRPRGWHLPERHLRLDGRAVPAALVDFGLYLFHNARALRASGTGPYFYLPKLESHLEARLWNDVFADAQRALDLPLGTIKATVLIETLPAAFEMDEILWELRDHAAGLNCGRWDYIFSFIKKLRADPRCVLPDRGDVTMEQPFLRAYAQLLVRTCHRRNAHAMGGMAAQIPVKGDPERNERALAKVRADKVREVTDGHDGTWVAHPGLVPVARAIFDEHMPGPNQIATRRREDVRVTAAELLATPAGPRTVAGLRHDVRVGVQYLESWLRGNGCVPLYDLMEDAATAEISRAQVWQWLRHGAALADADERAAPLDAARLRAVIDDEMGAFSGGRFAEARALFERLCTSETFEEFLTLPAYERLEDQPVPA